jgi:hypothetical protein
VQIRRSGEEIKTKTFATEGTENTEKKGNLFLEEKKVGWLWFLAF